MAATSTSKPIAIPILVGVTGKRKIKLDELDVPEAVVRIKLRRAFDLLDDLAPTSPKILLCGMADGVDEIAAKLVIEEVDELTPGPRKFHNWSIIGLLPLPEEAFLDDFNVNTGKGWWYHALDEKTQKPLIKLLPLETLTKPLPSSAASSSPTHYTVEELRRPATGSNPARTAHYEQLGMVLAERSTVLIAVMPENENPDRAGGTAQVVAHRLNGWRPGWPPKLSRDIAAQSAEIVSAPLATPVANDVWLLPIGPSAVNAGSIDLRILRRRKEFDEAWPQRSLSVSPGRRSLVPWPWRASPDVLSSGERSNKNAALDSCPLLRSIRAFNNRAANLPSRRSPRWDDTIAAHPNEPQLWSPLAAMERLRGAFSDIQRRRKARVSETIKQLSLIAGFSIALLELYAELFEKSRYGELLKIAPVIYVATILIAILLYTRAVRRSWPAVAEEYRLVAEALRVQIVWWQMGLTSRRDRVDNVILRYDAGEFQLLRQGLAAIIESIHLCHAEIPAVPVAAVPDLVMRWIDNECEPRGQVQYHERTKNERRRYYGITEFLAWSLFGISLGAATWLAAYVGLEAMNLVEGAMNSIGRISNPWLLPVTATLFGLGLLSGLGIRDTRSSERAFRAPHIITSWLAGISFGAAVFGFWAMTRWEPEGLRVLLFLSSVILLAWGGIIRYRAEKIAIEAEAEGSEMAYPVYRRAKAALDRVDAGQCADIEADSSWREEIIRDLGKFALAETEAWLRSHRERPLHPAL